MGLVRTKSPGSKAGNLAQRQSLTRVLSVLVLSVRVIVTFSLDHC